VLQEDVSRHADEDHHPEQVGQTEETRRARIPGRHRWLMEIELPLVINRPMPRSEVSVASVMMKGGRPMRTMPKPWKAPIATPHQQRQDDRKPRSARRPDQQPGDDDAGEADHGADGKVDAAVMMTKVWPTARIAVIEPCRSRFAMLLAGVQKHGRRQADNTATAGSAEASSVRPKRMLVIALGLFGAALSVVVVHAHVSSPFSQLQMPMAWVRTSS
jgi:hypothetical protein